MTAIGVPAGRRAVWWFLASEVLIFGGLIATYVIFRFRHPDWTENVPHMFRAAGVINTIVFLTSSLTMMLAQVAVKRGMLERAGRYLSLAASLAGIFIVVKAFEYGRQIIEGFTPVKGLFWTFYYAMTGLHALHVLGGIVAINVIGAKAKAGKNAHRVKYLGIYWHFTGLVWLVLFGLLYLML